MYLNIHGKRILIDAGPDLRQQVLRVGMQQLDALLLTHEHRDHTGGLGEIKSFVFQQAKCVPTYASARVFHCLQREFPYLFADELYQRIPHFKCHTIANHPFLVEGTSVMPIQVYHKHLPIWGFKIGALAYITDAKVIAAEEVAKLQGITTLVVNALQQEPNPSHFNLSEAIELAQQVNARVTYLTHIGHRMGMHQEVAESLPLHIHLAYDGLQVEVSD